MDMAKSYGNLWPRLVSWQNLVTAYQRCRRRKRYKPEAVRFDYDWEGNLLRLQRELNEGIYHPGDYRHFFIREPKTRKISAAPFRDRVVHHAIVQLLEPIYERRFIFDSYACRRGKGTHRALDRAQHYLRRHRLFLKTDIVRFFPNVDHKMLLDLLGRTIRDVRLMQLIRQIVESGDGVLRDQASNVYFRGDDLFALSRPRGLPIGNLTSQFFANVLLDPIDHFVKEELRAPGYVRYADDLVLFADDKQTLWKARDALSDRLAAVRLRLHMHKTQLSPSHKGLTFLGFVSFPRSRRLGQRALRRLNRRLRVMKWEFAAGRLAAKKIRQSLEAWSAHADHANARGIRQVLWKRARFVRRRADCP